MMLHALSTSDWHLEGLDKHFGEEGVDLQLQEIERIYLYAIERGIQYIFVPGDLSDRNTMRDSTKRKLLELLMRYDGKITTIYLSGNHDRSDSLHTSLDLIAKMANEWKFLKTFHVYFDATQFEVEGIVVNMIPHPSERSIPHKKPCLNFVHCDIVGANGDNGRPLRTSHEVEVDKRDFTIGGHIHLQQFLKSKRLLLNGSPYQKNFGESLPKGFVEFKARYQKGKLEVIHEFKNQVPIFIFETKLISTQQEFSTLSKSRYTRYRLLVEEGVIIPADLRIRYPNIAQIRMADSHALQSIVENGTLEVNTTSTAVVNPRKGLKARLKSFGADKRQVRRGMELLKTALTEIGYSAEQ